MGRERQRERDRKREKGKQAKELQFLTIRTKNYIALTMPGFTIF